MNQTRNKTAFNPKALLRPGVLLVVLTVLSLLISNSFAGRDYMEFWQMHAGFSSGREHVSLTLTEWINDGLMAFFFLLVGLEIHREIIYGQLSSFKKAALPFFAAAGGMIVPALIYVAFNYHSGQLRGWGVPTATDIAFALAVLSVAGKQTAGKLKVFLTALAIIDDLGAVLVIALFYTSSINLFYISIVAAVYIILITLNKTGVRNPVTYTLAGMIMWYAMLKSGVHATVAGVLMATCIPVNRDPQESMLHKLEHLLEPFCSYFVLPLFVLANAALIIDASAFHTAPFVALGIICGLVIGKPLGITLFSYLSVRLNAAELPPGLSMRSVTGAGLLGGVGFTMAMFISSLAFDEQQLQDLSKIAVFTASVIAALAGFFFLRRLSSSH